MRKFKLRKIVPLTLLALVGLSLSTQAQDSTKAAAPAMAAKPADSSKSLSNYGPVKTFGGTRQFAAWSVGVNVGALSPQFFIGTNQFSHNQVSFGYAAFLKYQFSHDLAVRVDYVGGQLKANNAPSTQNSQAPAFGNTVNITTKLNYGVSIKGEVDVASINFLKRRNGIRFFVTGGYGLAGFNPSDYGTKKVKSGYVPIGAGIKFRASEAFAVNLGYDAYFFDASNVMGSSYVAGDARQSKASMGYIGLEYIFGAGNKKQALIWNNPVAGMYDELKNNDSLSKEIDGLKSRVTAVEGDVSNLKKDSDGDGVSDVFDKCPNTPAGTKVDGSGCELPKVQTAAPDSAATAAVDNAPKDRVQFDFDSDKIRANSYPTLDRLADRLKSENSKMLLAGHASSEGTEQYNMGLSTRRANSVHEYLVGKGVPSKNVKVKGYGETRPIASNDTEEGRQKNRRVEFRFGAAANVSTGSKHHKSHKAK